MDRGRAKNRLSQKCFHRILCRLQIATPCFEIAAIEGKNALVCGKKMQKKLTQHTLYLLPCPPYNPQILSQ